MPRNRTTTRIIKKHRVKTAGARRIGAPIAADHAVPEPQARIVEQSGRTAAVEVACTCGRRIYLQLDYAPASDAPPPQATPPPPARDD